MAIDLTFGSGGGGGGGSSSGEYVKDTFKDTSLPATDNNDLTSSASVNPMSKFFGNDDAPKYSSKTLYIKGIELIDDRSKWLNNKPTYEIIWNETFPGVYGYVVGNPRKLSFALAKGISVLAQDVGDIIGITGNIRNIMWLVNPSAADTASALRSTDGVADTNITFNSQSLNAIGQGINKYAAFLQDSTNETDDIHDYRLTANELGTLSLAGVVVYFENASNDVKIFSGNTFVDKDLVPTTGITSMPLAVGETTMGFNSVISKLGTGVYTSSAQSVLALITGAAGSSGTNSLTLTAGTGASYTAGMGFVAQQGTSYHVGNISSISTDTITAGNTLPFSLAGATLWRSWNASSTAAISATLFSKKFEFNSIYASNPIEAASFGASATGNYMYSEPSKAYRAWGSLQQSSSYSGIPVLTPMGATSGFLQIDGDFQAAEVEWVALGSSSVLHGTFSINGLGGYGQNTGFSGITKQTIFTDGQNGINSINFTPGASFFNMGISRINLYQLAAPVGPTLGRLAEISTYAGFVPRSAYNATFMALGLDQRHYADEFFLQGAWSRAATTTAAGGVRFIGTSTSAVFKYQYYGKDFALLGTAGTSSILTVDGTSSSIAFNTIKSVATLGFHTIQFSCQSGTHLIEAIDIFKPKKEIVNLQNFSPLAELANITKTYIQTETPQNANDGDMWSQLPLTSNLLPKVWIRLMGYWMQLDVANIADDPQFDELFVYGGVNIGSTAINVNQTFNETSWSFSVSMPEVKRHMGNGTGQYNGKGMAACGDNSVSLQGTTYSFNKSSWAANVTRSVTRSIVSNSQAFGFYYINKGVSVYLNSANPSTNCGKFNYAAWSEVTAWSASRSYSQAFFVSGILSDVGGYTSALASTDSHEQRNSADSVSAATIIPATYSQAASSNVNEVLSLITGRGGADFTAYAWNGVTWSASLTNLKAGTDSNSNYSSSKKVSINTGGTNAGVYKTDVCSFNGISFSLKPNMSLALAQHCSSSF